MIRRIPRTGFSPVRARDTQFWIRKLLVGAEIPEQLLRPNLQFLGGIGYLKLRFSQPYADFIAVTGLVLSEWTGKGSRGARATKLRNSTRLVAPIS